MELLPLNTEGLAKELDAVYQKPARHLHRDVRRTQQNRKTVKNEIKKGIAFQGKS